MDEKKLQQLERSLENLIQSQKYSQGNQYFPETGEYSRDKYPKQMEFIEKSQFHSVMGIVGANGSGKTTLGSCFTRWHGTGKYPKWYNGHRFNQGPLNMWVSCLSTKQMSAIQDSLF